LSAEQYQSPDQHGYMQQSERPLLQLCITGLAEFTIATITAELTLKILAELDKYKI